MQDFRTLYNTLIEYQGDNVVTDVLSVWMSEAESEVKWLHELAARSQGDIPKVSERELESLYALSRVNDIFLLRFQSGKFDGNWKGVDISLVEYKKFFKGLGLVEYGQAHYHPFFHEVVEVSDKGDFCEYWPTLMLGSMLFSRAGVRCPNSTYVTKGVADRSTIYWTFRRSYRPCEDLSHGWGHNSQWGTSLRRDYYIGDRLFYNVEGVISAEVVQEDDEDNLSCAQRIELVRNRCFTCSTREHTDLWPYDWSYQEDLWTQQDSG